MTRIIMHGCNGRMGKMIYDVCKEDPGADIVAGVDLTNQNDKPYPVFTDITECKIHADAVIDFSTAAAVDGVLAHCVERKLPLVLCTTGLSEAQWEGVKRASETIPVLKSANMSLGINTLASILKQAAQALAPAGFDIEIVEKHHNQKLDAPSGTALFLADQINAALDAPYAYRYDRSQERKPREPREIGISAVRGGTIPGEHEVIFAGMDEVITIRHTAFSRSIFAKGAIAAAKYLAEKAPGLYDMQEVAGDGR